MSSNPEQLSEQFDHGRLDIPALSLADQQLIEEWQRFGGQLRNLPVAPANVVSSLDLNANQKPLAGRRPTSAASGRISVLISAAAICLVAGMASLVVKTPNDWWAASTPMAALDVSRQFDRYDVMLMQVADTESPAREAIVTSLDNEGIVSRLQNESLDSLASVIEAQVSEDELEGILISEGLNPERDSNDLLSRFVESLQTPTRSELYFNEVVIVLPQEVLDEVHRKVSPEAGGRRPKIYVVMRRLFDTCDFGSVEG